MSDAPGTVVVDDVHKSFRVYHSRSTKDALVRIARRQPLFERRPVLRGVSLKAAPGERVGIVGRNGVGKSTLFRLLSRIMRPDKGRIETVGRVSSLVEITAGLVPDLSGAENILLNAAVLGLSRTQIRERFERIIDFAELHDFVETPVRYYSSGMQARLGFSVAVHVDADILLIDEALSVGDGSFQDRCIARMKELAGSGKTIIMVSHDLRVVRAFCERAVWIEDGRVHSDGDADEVLSKAEAAFHNA